MAFHVAFLNDCYQTASRLNKRNAAESFAEHGFSKKEFDDNEELVDIEEEESPETADDDIFADEVLDDEE